MIYKLWTSVDGKPGEFIEDWHGLDTNLIRVCYSYWPEYVAYEEALAARKDGEWPNEPLGRPPFEIQRPDGSWHEWFIHKAYEVEDEAGEEVVLNESVSCQRCGSHRVAQAGGKCSDLGYFYMGSIDHDGYVPEGVGIGGGDDVDITYCLDCGQMQGTFPLPISDIEKGIAE